MWLDIAEAPADVPATTAPCRNRSRIASASRVPPIVDDSRSWLPPVRKTPVASRIASVARVVVGLRPGDGVERPDLLDAELREHRAVPLARLQPERRRGADDRDRRVGAAGERDEPVQDDAVADLVLRAADDDHGSVGQQTSSSLAASAEDSRRSPRPAEPCTHRPPGLATGWCGAVPCPAWENAPAMDDLPEPELRPVPGSARGLGPNRGRAVRRRRPRHAAPRRRLPAGAPSRGVARPRPASHRGDHPAERHVRADPVRDDRPGRGRRGRCPRLLGGRPDLAQRRRSVPSDRAVPALRLRAVDAPAVHALGGAAVGRRLVRLARRDDPAAAVDDRLGLPAAPADHGRHGRPARVPVRRQPRHRQHQPAAHPDAVGRPVHRAARRRPALGAGDLDEVDPGRPLADPRPHGRSCGAWSGWPSRSGSA